MTLKAALEKKWSKDIYDDKNVGVVFGGESDEREISLKTGQALVKALQDFGLKVQAFDVPMDFDKLRQARPKAVLLATHGGYGEDGRLQGWLEMEGIAYTGSGVLASCLGMDKRRSKALFESMRIPVPKGCYLSAGAQDQWIEAVKTPKTLCKRYGLGTEIMFPVVLKRNATGSSYGVSWHKDARSLWETLTPQLETLCPQDPMDGFLIEQYVQGKEYTVGFFDDLCLGVMQVIPANGFYDLESKYYAKGQTQYLFVEPGDLKDALVDVGRRAYDAIGCQGVARVDVMGHLSDLRVLEVNTLPGMTESSLVPKMAVKAGLSFPEFAYYMLCGAGVGYA